MLQSELQTRLNPTQQNTTKQTKVTEQPVTGLSPTALPYNMQHAKQKSMPQKWSNPQTQIAKSRTHM